MNGNREGVQPMAATAGTLWLEDFRPGTVFTGGPRLIGEKDLLYCTLWNGDGQPHSNEEYSKNSPWGSRIVHGDGMLAVGMGLVLKQGMFRDSMVGCRSMSIRYPRPVYVQDEISSRLTIGAVTPTSDTEGEVTAELEVRNDTRDFVAIQSTIHYIVKRRP
jgi:acyl dehydratase